MRIAYTVFMTFLIRIHRLTEAALGARAYRLLRYLMSGAAAAASNLAVLFILVRYGRMYYLYASVLAFIASVAISFTLQKFWTFQDRLIHDMRTQFIRYSVVVLMNLSINTALMYLFVEKMGLWYLLAQALTTSVVAIIGYIAYRRLVFPERATQL